MFIFLNKINSFSSSLLWMMDDYEYKLCWFICNFASMSLYWFIYSFILDIGLYRLLMFSKTVPTTSFVRTMLDCVLKSHIPIILKLMLTFSSLWPCETKRGMTDQEDEMDDLAYWKDIISELACACNVKKKGRRGKKAGQCGSITYMIKSQGSIILFLIILILD